MKNAILLHGTGSTPDSFWLPYIKRFLEKKGYAVWDPILPDAEKYSRSTVLPFVLDGGKFKDDTVMIGHSAGCPLILSVLERIGVKIDKAILVAGFAQPYGPNKTRHPILQPEYDWEKIRAHVKTIIFISSDNDPWGCDDTQGRYMFDNLGGTQIILHGEGHFGSDKFSQPYKEFPLLKNLLE